MQKKYCQARESFRKARKHIVTSILHRFQESETDRAAQFEHNWDEKHCKELGKFTLENDSHLATPEERKRHENTWVLTRNSQGQVEPKRQRADHPDAKKRFQEWRTQEGDEHVVIPPSEQQRQRPHHNFMRRSEDLTLRRKKPVALSSAQEKPEETTGSQNSGHQRSTGKLVAKDSNESYHIVDPTTGWRTCTSHTNSSSTTSWWQAKDCQSSRSWTEY